jgi:hypothetical protein
MRHVLIHLLNCLLLVSVALLSSCGHLKRISPAREEIVAGGHYDHLDGSHADYSNQTLSDFDSCTAMPNVIDLASGKHHPTPCPATD